VDYAQAELHHYCPELLSLEIDIVDSPLTGSILWTAVHEYCGYMRWDITDMTHLQLKSAVRFAENSLDHALGAELYFRYPGDPDLGD
jgi:hypothetical protein